MKIMIVEVISLTTDEDDDYDFQESKVQDVSDLVSISSARSSVVISKEISRSTLYRYVENVSAQSQRAGKYRLNRRCIRQYCFVSLQCVVCCSASYIYQ